MKTLTQLIGLSLVLMVSACSTAFQTSGYDDVYYSPKDKPVVAATPPAGNANNAPVATEAPAVAPDNDYNYQPQESPSSETNAQRPSDSRSYTETDQNGNTYITNNYYDEDDYYDYSYSTRIRRFYEPNYCYGYYDSYYTNMYYYDHNPNSWGVSVYTSYPWWYTGVSVGYSPYYYSSYNHYWGYENPWHSPYYGYSGYGYYGYSSYGHGYNHGYNDGFRHGYNDGQNNDHYYNSWDNNSSYSYGRRNNVGGASNHATNSRGSVSSANNSRNFADKYYERTNGDHVVNTSQGARTISRRDVSTSGSIRRAMETNKITPAPTRTVERRDVSRPNTSRDANSTPRQVTRPREAAPVNREIQRPNTQEPTRRDRPASTVTPAPVQRPASNDTRERQAPAQPRQVERPTNQNVRPTPSSEAPRQTVDPDRQRQSAPVYREYTKPEYTQPKSNDTYTQPSNQNRAPQERRPNYSTPRNNENQQPKTYSSPTYNEPKNNDSYNYTRPSTPTYTAPSNNGGSQSRPSAPSGGGNRRR